MNAIDTNAADYSATDYEADYCEGTWTVTDDCGARWWPSAEAEEEILTSDDPETTALALCRSGRGAWHS